MTNSHPLTSQPSFRFHGDVHMKDDVINVKDAVELILKRDERSRDDDKWLIIQVLREMGFNIFIPYEKLKSLPAFESITRCRRKFQEQGLYQANKKTVDERRSEETKMRKIDEWFPK